MKQGDRVSFELPGEIATGIILEIEDDEALIHFFSEFAIDGGLVWLGEKEFKILEEPDPHETWEDEGGSYAS